MGTRNFSGVNTVTFDVRASRTGSNIKFGLHNVGGPTTEITPNILIANTWQTITWDLSAVANDDKDAIDTFTITVVNDDVENIFYVDNFEKSEVIPEVGTSLEVQYDILAALATVTKDLQCKYNLFTSLATQTREFDYKIGSILDVDLQSKYHIFAGVVTKNLELDYEIGSIVHDDCQSKYNIYAAVVTRDLECDYKMAMTAVTKDCQFKYFIFHYTDYGPNFLTGGTATAQSDGGYGYTPDKAVDGNTHTRWSTGDYQPLPRWWQYDLGSGVTQAATKLRIITTMGLYKDFTLQGSNNGIDWTLVYTGQQPNTDDWETFTFANTTAYRYYRLIASSNWRGDNYVGFFEVEMMANVAVQPGRNLELDYQIGSTIYDDLQSKYHLIASIASQSREFDYNIGTGAISDDLQLRYTIFQLTGKSVEYQYMIGSIVNDDVSCKYTIRHAVLKDLQCMYDMGSIIGKSVEFNYKLSNIVTKNLEIDYSIGSLVHKDLQTQYYIFKAVNTSIEFIYHIGAIISNSIQLKYDLYANLGQSKLFNYQIGSIVDSSVALQYIIRGLVTTDYQLMYNVGTTAHNSVEFKYGILSAPIKMLQAIYNIGSIIGQSKEFKYRVFSDAVSAVGRTTDFRYVIGSGAINNSIELKYRMLYVTALLMGKYGIHLRPGNPTHLQSQFNDLMGLYHFNEYAYSGESNDVRDQSGYGHHGTVLGSSPYPTTEAGLFDRACRLQPGGFIKIPHHSHFNLTSPFTIMFWMKPRVSFTNYEDIIRKGTWGQNNYHVYLSSNGKLTFGSTSLGELTSTTEFQLDKWYFITCKYTGTSLYIYVNGYLDNTVASSSHPAANGSDLYIGNGFNGNLDELVILNQQLSYTRMIDYYLKQPTTARTNIHPVEV